MSTLGRFLRLPTAGVAGEWGAADNALCADFPAYLINNAEHLCEENNLRTLYEYAGPYSKLFGNLGTTSDVQTFLWDAVPGDSTGENGTLVLHTGKVRLREHGTSGKWPSVEWRWRWSSGLDGGSPVTIGALAVVTPTWQRPSVGFPYASTTYADSAWGDGTLSVDLAGYFDPESVAYSPTGGIAGTPSESGRVTEVVCWIGFWSSYLTKTVESSVAGVTCFLEAP